jgi:hypothetical protein
MCSDPNTATRQSSKYARQELASDTYGQGGGVPNREYMSAAASMTEIRERLLQYNSHFA